MESNGSSQIQKDRDNRHELFLQRLSMVAGQGIYTLSSLSGLFGCDDTPAREFVRLCEMAPQAKVIESRGRNSIRQYQFRLNESVSDVWDRCRGLLDRLGKRPDSNRQDYLDAVELRRLLESPDPNEVNIEAFTRPQINSFDWGPEIVTHSPGS